MTQDPNLSSGPAWDDAAEPVKEVAKTAGRLLLWIVIAVAVVVIVLAVFLLGPFGLALVVPALLVVWLAAALSAGGPAIGA
jgi:hypothetical protein